MEIENGDGLAMVAELLEGERFQHFLERAEAARQGHEGVAPLVHDRLAVPEPVGDHELREARVAHAELQERLGDDPGDLAPVSEDCPGQTAHEAHASASVDEPPSAPGELGPELLGRSEVLSTLSLEPQNTVTERITGAIPWRASDRDHALSWASATPPSAPMTTTSSGGARQTFRSTNPTRASPRSAGVSTELVQTGW